MSLFGAVADAYVAAASVTQVDVAAANARSATSSGAFASMTWTVTFPHAVNFTSYVADIFTAGNYDFVIDGTTVASVSSVAAAQTGVTFTPAAPVALTAGVHTFKLTCGVSARYYFRGTPSLTGTGADYIGWDNWQEGGTSPSVAGTINFQVPNTMLAAKVAATRSSSGMYSGQTWDITFDTAVTLHGIVKQMLSADSGYTLKVDSVAVSSATPRVIAGPLAIACTTPVALSAGTHTFSVIPTAAAARFSYVTGTTTAPTGDTHVTTWGEWQEATGNQPDGVLVYELP